MSSPLSIGGFFYPARNVRGEAAYAARTLSAGHLRARSRGRLRFARGTASSGRGDVRRVRLSSRNGCFFCMPPAGEPCAPLFDVAGAILGRILGTILALGGTRVAAVDW